MRILLLPVLFCATTISALKCGNPPNNQLFRDEMNADTDCGTECGDMCFQRVEDANMFFAGGFQSVVGTSTATFLEECTGTFVQAGHDVSCNEVRDDQGSIKVAIEGPEDEIRDAREAGRTRETFLPRFCSRTLMDCVAPLGRGCDAIHQCPLDAAAPCFC